MTRSVVALLACAIASVADVALACPSCASPLEENRQAFVDTTIFLTVVPLAMIGGFVWWLHRKARENEPPPEIIVPDGLLKDFGHFSNEGSSTLERS